MLCLYNLEGFIPLLSVRSARRLRETFSGASRLWGSCREDVEIVCLRELIVTNGLLNRFPVFASFTAKKKMVESL